MERITVHFNQPVRAMKPVHGVNNGPKTRLFSLDMSRYFVEAGIPYSRLHDTEYPYGSGHFVDIPCIFPDFAADPQDPAAYDFTLTDEYIAAIVAAGTQVFYRLGVSIEHASKKYNIYPPTDNQKWADICLGIIRHYNEGWANGYHYGIEYWEIWNEPENPPMWQGNMEQYFALYEIAACTIKSKYPALKVGGYASCGFYAITRESQTPFYQGFVTYFTDFLSFVRQKKLPLDFFSWHLYTTDVNEMVAHARYVRRTLDQFGFSQTESIVNEWNYVTSSADRFVRMKTLEAAAFVAAVLCALQQEAVDMGNYYDAQPNMRYCGLFDYEKARKPFYALAAFNSLYRLQTQVESSCTQSGIWTCAAANEEDGALLIVNTNEEAVQLMLELHGFAARYQADVYILDESGDLDLRKREYFSSVTSQLVVKADKKAIVLCKLKAVKE